MAEHVAKEGSFGSPATAGSRCSLSGFRILDGCETCRDILAVLLMGMELREKYRDMGVAIFATLEPRGWRLELGRNTTLHGKRRAGVAMFRAIKHRLSAWNPGE